MNEKVCPDPLLLGSTQREVLRPVVIVLLVPSESDSDTLSEWASVASGWIVANEGEEVF